MFLLGIHKKIMGYGTNFNEPTPKSLIDFFGL